MTTGKPRPLARPLRNITHSAPTLLGHPSRPSPAVLLSITLPVPRWPRPTFRMTISR